MSAAAPSTAAAAVASPAHREADAAPGHGHRHVDDVTAPDETPVCEHLQNLYSTVLNVTDTLYSVSETQPNEL